MSGWYKRQRNIPERPWFKDSKVVQLFDYLEATAYVVEGKYEGLIIRRGSLPTTRPEMMEATGLSYKEVDRCLRKLISYGEIIVKGYYRFSVITVCYYDSCNMPLSLFGTTEGTTEGTEHLSTIEERYKDNLISHNIPYKKEREVRNKVLEIKKRYNKTFDGKLPPLIRLHEPTERMVLACLDQFGEQSVDMVFEQVLNEPFSLGQNKTGFIANFQYIFSPTNFQQYLERAKLRLKKKEQPQPQKSVGVIEQETSTPRPTDRQKDEGYRQRLIAMVAMLDNNPRHACRAAVEEAYRSGELQRLGIEKPSNI